ncbi:MAG: DUF488 family protein [Chitinophagaceae bacterium]
MYNIQLKRAYAPAEKKDGFRILIDRLWPRGITKAHAHADVWMKTIGPSAELRKWFDHDPAKWMVFKKKYMVELKQSRAVPEILEYCKTNKMVTLLYAAKDEAHNHAIVLRLYLNARLK